jgi:hypothetical protein
MLWTDEAGRTRRPVVVIEDHLYHTGELLEAVAAAVPDRLHHLTVCALDRPGPDTVAAVNEWTVRYRGVQIVTWQELGDLKPADHGAFARAIGQLVRPGGIVLQDIQLETLPFIPADRWWESIYLGATIRGLFADRPPIIRFCSNKRGYDVTFGKDLLDAGFDPRDVMHKSDMVKTVVPAVLLRLMDVQFPSVLRVLEFRGSGAQGSRNIPVSDADRVEVERECDVVLWRAGTGTTIGGRALGSQASLKTGSPEIETWRLLIEDRLSGGEGIAVVDVGQRLAEAGAERAELTNIAARHIHGLRARLADGEVIQTAHHRYRLADGLSVGLVS